METRTVGEARREGARRLRAAGKETPDLDAALLLARALGLDRSRLLALDDRPLDADAEAEFRGLVERRAAGQCAAWLVGHKEFRGLDLDVTPDTLVPRPETETLVEAAEEWGAPLPFRVLDLCTGSGAVALALKQERPRWEVFGADVSEAALAVARRNAEKFALAVTFSQGDLFEGTAPGPFDLITANAPYLRSDAIGGLAPEARAEPRLALDGGADGLDLIRRIAAEAPCRLAAGGGLLLEAAPDQMDAIAVLLSGAGFTGIRFWRDLAGDKRVAGGLTCR